MCEDCFVQGGYELYPDQELQELKSDQRFPEKHRGLDRCPSRQCRDVRVQHLSIVYDDEDDEWLFCTHCKKFKQLLRVWNKVTNSMVDALDRPILRWQSAGSNSYGDLTSEESGGSGADSDDDSSSSESKGVEAMDGSYDSDQSNANNGSAEDNDIPLPEPIVYRVKPTANGFTREAASATVPSIAAPTANNLLLNSDSVDGARRKDSEEKKIPSLDLAESEFLKKHSDGAEDIGSIRERYPKHWVAQAGDGAETFHFSSLEVRVPSFTLLRTN